MLLFLVLLRLLCVIAAVCLWSSRGRRIDLFCLCSFVVTIILALFRKVTLAAAAAAAAAAVIVIIAAAAAAALLHRHFVRLGDFWHRQRILPFGLSRLLCLLKLLQSMFGAVVVVVVAAVFEGVLLERPVVGNSDIGEKKCCGDE